MRAWFYATMVATLCVAAPAPGQELDPLFGGGGEAESAVKAETAATAPASGSPAQAGVRGEKGEAGARGECGLAGARGRDGRDGKPGATRTIRRTVLVPTRAQAPAQPASVNGHVGTPGHGGVYREVEDWHPASTSRVDLRNAQLSSRISGETEERQKADGAIRQQMMAQKNKEKKTMELIGGIFAGLLIALLAWLFATRGGAGAGATATATANGGAAPAAAAAGEADLAAEEAARGDLVLGLSDQDQRVAILRRTQCGGYRHETVKFYVGSPLVRTSGEAGTDVESCGSTIRKPPPAPVSTVPAQQVTVETSSAAASEAAALAEIRSLRDKIRRDLKKAGKSPQGDKPAPATPPPPEPVIPADQVPSD